MDWTTRMNTAIDYIEENLAGNIDYSKAAEKAFCSTFHFQRMFLAVCGITPAEYVRRRRLTLAVTELSDDLSKVIDIALKYGYESPDAFTRAFRNMHGITPTAAREPGVKLTAYPRISFQIQITGGNDMDYRIIETPAFNTAMVSRKFTNIGGQNFKDIPTWWEEFMKSPDCATITTLSGGKPGTITGGTMLGICYGEEETGENPVHDTEFGFEGDNTPTQGVERAEWTDYQRQQLRSLSQKLEELCNFDDDNKLASAELIIEDWLKSGFNPVVYCRFIPTANYVGKQLAPVLKKKFPKLDLQVVTSELPDELRRLVA